MGSIRKWRNEILNIFIFALVSRQSAALSSDIQHAMPLEFGGKSWANCLNVGLLPTLLHVGYSVKLNKNIIRNWVSRGAAAPRLTVNAKILG